MKPAVWLLLLAASIAHATTDNPCDLPGNKVEVYFDAVDFPMSTCKPWPRGPGTVPNLRANSAGMTGWYFCKRSDGSWGRVLRAGTWAKLSQTFMDDLQAELASPTADFDAITQRRIDTPMSDPSLVPVWCPWTQTIWESQPPHDPSADGARLPPAAVLWDTQASWKIVNGWAVRGGVQTSGHATELLWKGGAIYAKSPTGGVWWKWLGNNLWQRGTTTMP